MPSSNSGVPDVLPFGPSPQSLHRQHATQELVNRLVVQLLLGCGDTSCSTPACANARINHLPRPVRRYTSISARAMAVVMASSDDAEAHVCPNLLNCQTPLPSTEAQEKLDPKSIIQQLCNTEALRSFHFPLSTPDELPRKLGKRPVGDYGSGPNGIDLKPTESYVTTMTCDELAELRTYLTSVKPLKRASAGTHSEDISSSLNRISAVLSDYSTLSSSFTDDPMGLSGLLYKPAVSTIPSIRLDYIFRDWSEIGQANIFDSIWLGLEPIFESPFAPRSQQPKKFVTLPPRQMGDQVARVTFTAIHALTASVPRTQRDTWLVVWSTIINGRAYGKQRCLADDVYFSPWLHILDSFEYEPALRMAKRLIRAIGARVCLEETLSACGVARSEQEPHLRDWTFPQHLKTRKSILIMLIREEQTIRKSKFNTIFRDEMRHGKHILGTTSLVWLEWLRKCFLKDWDGSYRVNRWGVAGSALEMIEELWKYRGREYLDMPEDLFPTPVVFNHLDVDKAALDWVSFKHDPNSRHLFSFQFLFSARGSTLFFRTVNHILMRRAYGEAETAMHLRSRTVPRSNSADTAYLDRRMRAAQEHYLVLKINRRSILSDAFDQLWHREKRELLRPLRVRMGVDEGEIGHDLGGVQIEFFKLACQEAFDPNYSLFTIDPNTRLAWFQPGSLVPLYKFQLFGLLFALAIYNGITLPVSFPMVFYRKLLFQPCDEHDLRDGWPSLTKSLRDLRNHEGSVEEDFARDYVYSFTANGLHLDVDMNDPWDGWSIWEKANTGRSLTSGRMKIINSYQDKHHPDPSSAGRDSRTDDVDPIEPTADGISPINLDTSSTKGFNWPGWNIEMADPAEEPQPVTNENRKKYIEDYAKWVMDWSVRPQFMSFAKGFYAMMHTKALTLLNAETMRNLVEGQNHLDISALQRAATYQGYTATTPIIRWFWETVLEYPQHKQKQLLEFVTASSRVPINGAESLTFVIERSEGDPAALPGSSTCFGTLRLPEYESKEVLKQKLDIALEHSLGFGQA